MGDGVGDGSGVGDVLGDGVGDGLGVGDVLGEGTGVGAGVGDVPHNSHMSWHLLLTSAEACVRYVKMSSKGQPCPQIFFTGGERWFSTSVLVMKKESATISNLLTLSCDSFRINKQRTHDRLFQICNLIVHLDRLCRWLCILRRASAA